MAATIAWALCELPEAELKRISAGCGTAGRVVLWLVGAREAMEGELVRGGHLAEPLARFLKASCCIGSSGLELVLIGPEMRSWEDEYRLTCDAVSSPSIIVRSLSGTLHAVAGGGALVDSRSVGGAPDAVVLLNSGIGTLLWPLVEQWLPTISLLLSLDVPILCTCFNAHEAEGEEVVLRDAFKARTLVPSRTNPFAHSVPLDVIATTTNGAPMKESEMATLAAEREAAAIAAGGPRSNSYIKWVRGSSLSLEELEGSARLKASDLIKACAKCFAIKNMEAWVESLSRADEVDVATGSDAEESVAANAMLIAEATANEPTIGLLAFNKGALAALRNALIRWAPLLRVDCASASASREGLTYAGQPAVERIVTAATAAVANIERAVAAGKAIEQVPDGHAIALASGPLAYRNVFRGEFVNVRAQPATQSAVVARLERGARVMACAEHGDWVQLLSDDSAGAPSSCWVLRKHPTLGVLLQPEHELTIDDA
jgi:hypothetical protein